MTTSTAAARAVALSNPAGLYDPAPNGYSHLATISPSARLALPAGQGGQTEDGSLAPDFGAQVRQAFANLTVALAAGGAGPRDVAKLTVLIVDHTDEKLRILGEEFGRTFGAGLKPACTLIPVPRLALDGMMFEVEAIAAVAA